MQRFTVDQIQYMSREVKRQGDGPEHVSGMAQAMEYVLDHGISDIGDIHMVNHYTTLQKTRYGYRTTAVTFRHGGASCNASVIHDAMDRWFAMTVEMDWWSGHTTQSAELVEEATKQFLYIHPYEDGNGRTASILRNAALELLDYPCDLPDYSW